MKTRISGPWIIIILLTIFKLIIHFLTNTNYELHRDAYLYLAMADHLDFGYLSVPPSIAYVGAVMRFFFGDSVFAVRLAPALIGAASVAVIGMFVRELGGRSWAILIACLAFITSPAFLRSNTLFQPVTFNQFYWLLSSFFILRLFKHRDPKYWYLIFSLWGLAFLNKYSIAFYAFSIVVAFLFSRERNLMLNKYFVQGLGIGFLIAFPNLMWQFRHNWPVVHHMLDLQQSQLIHVTIIDFFTMQILMNFPQIAVWVTGLIFLLCVAPGKEGRIFAYGYLILLFTFIILRGKPYYTLGIYPVLFVAGAVAIEYFSATRLKFLKFLPVPLMLILLIPILPFSLPILQPEAMAVYGETSRNYGLAGALRWEDGQIHHLPQDYADMIGWEEMAGIVINTYLNLPADEQQNTTIYAENYGEAGAVKYFGKPYGLPEPVSFNESFLFWAPDSLNLTTLIYVNNDTADIAYFFQEIKLMGRLTNPYARERGIPVYLCRQPGNNFEQFYRQKVRELRSVYE